MVQYSLRDAEKQLGKLIEDAQNGETIVILNSNNQRVQLLPIANIEKRNRKAGSAKGLIKMADDFDAPLSDFDEYMT